MWSPSVETVAMWMVKKSLGDSLTLQKNLKIFFLNERGFKPCHEQTSVLCSVQRMHLSLGLSNSSIEVAVVAMKPRNCTGPNGGYTDWELWWACHPFPFRFHMTVNMFSTD